MLNDRQFWYHSSKRNLTPGVDQILPANDPRVGGSNYGYSRHDRVPSHEWGGQEDRGDYTFAADTEEEAEAWTPSGHGRPVTYVVTPPGGPVEPWETEDEHVLTSGQHAKIHGPMDIVDRIDIPMPNHPNEAVQGTLPPQNWGLLNGLPKDYTGPATVGQQHPETDNFRRISPAYEALKRENAEMDADEHASFEAQKLAAKWKRAGQQTLFGDQS